MARYTNGVLTDGLNVPNGVIEQCQCVWDHRDPTFYTTIGQCSGHKSTDSNFFCQGCHDGHTASMEEVKKKQLIP